MNLGFKFEDLNDKTVKDLGIDVFNKKYNDFITKYKQALLEHIC
jgi:hypothetical protein